eukprot:5559619-Pleurochrysis_carterae.AAC.1
MPGTGIDVQKAYNKTAVHADEARRVMRAYPLTTFLVMAVAVIISSQPSTHAPESTAPTAPSKNAFAHSKEDWQEQHRYDATYLTASQCAAFSSPSRRSSLG